MHLKSSHAFYTSLSQLIINLSALVFYGGTLVIIGHLQVTGSDSEFQLHLTSHVCRTFSSQLLGSTDTMSLTHCLKKIRGLSHAGCFALLTQMIYLKLIELICISAPIGLHQVG